MFGVVAVVETYDAHLQQQQRRHRLRRRRHCADVAEHQFQKACQISFALDAVVFGDTQAAENKSS